MTAGPPPLPAIRTEVGQQWARRLSPHYALPLRALLRHQTHRKHKETEARGHLKRRERIPPWPHFLCQAAVGTPRGPRMVLSFLSSRAPRIQVSLSCNLSSTQQRLSFRTSRCRSRSKGGFTQQAGSLLILQLDIITYKVHA